MHNVYTEFKKYLQFSSLEDQLLEMDLFIGEVTLIMVNTHTLILKENRTIKQLKKLRHDILLNQ